MKYLKLIPVVCLFCITIASTLFAESEKDTSKKLSRIERYIFGDELKGSISNRANQIEEDLFGRTTGKKESEKISYLHDFIFKGTAQSLSLDMKLSYLEWKIFNKTCSGPLNNRLTELDKIVFGHISLEPMAFRLEQLVHMVIEDGFIQLKSVVIPEGTII